MHLVTFTFKTAAKNHIDFFMMARLIALFVAM